MENPYSYVQIFEARIFLSAEFLDLLPIYRIALLPPLVSI